MWTHDSLFGTQYLSREQLMTELKREMLRTLLPDISVTDIVIHDNAFFHRTGGLGLEKIRDCTKEDNEMIKSYNSFVKLFEKKPETEPTGPTPREN